MAKYATFSNFCNNVNQTRGFLKITSVQLVIYRCIAKIAIKNMKEIFSIIKNISQKTDSHWYKNLSTVTKELHIVKFTHTVYNEFRNAALYQLCLSTVQKLSTKFCSMKSEQSNIQRKMVCINGFGISLLWSDLLFLQFSARHQLYYGVWQLVYHVLYLSQQCQPPFRQGHCTCKWPSQ